MLTDERIREIAESVTDKLHTHTALTMTAIAPLVASAIRQALKEAQEWRDMESAPKGKPGFPSDDDDRAGEPSYDELDAILGRD